MKKLPKGFTLKEKGRIQYISCDAIEKTGQFTQGFTLRKGGFSRKPFDSLNTGLHTDDNKNDVRKNIRLIETELGAKYIAAAHQVHGDNVVVVQGSRGQGSNGQGAADRDLKIKIQKLRYI